MKGYCTTNDVRLALSPLGEPDGTASTLTDPQIEDSIDEAEAVVDTYLSARYTITTFEVEDTTDPNNILVYTVAPVPVRGWTRNIAAYLAALTYRRNKDLSEDDPVRLRFNMTMGLLKDVRDRNSDLSLPVVVADQQGVHVENLYEGTLFGPEDLALQPGYDTVYDPQVFWPARRDV